jgi:U4/U6.U5 tri-snRNP-associated protein 1
MDDKTIAHRARDLDSNFVDDEELQAALARSRRAKIPRTTKLSPPDIAAKVAAERVRDEAESAQEIVMVVEDETAGGLTFDDTSEFVRAIQYNPLEATSEPEGATIKQHPQEISVAQGEELEEIEAGEVKVENDKGAIEATREVMPGDGDSEDIGTSSQQHYGSSMASTLTLLRQQGVLTTPTTDQIEREQTQLQRNLWLAEQRLRLTQRQLDKLQGRGRDKDQATREYENRVREQQEARNSLEAFKDYKPPIDLTEYDEFGRAMTRKESWKALSHKFHGKGSGKMKLDKRLKKIADEKKREAMLSGDTPLSMNQAFQQRQEKTGQAYFVLSVGNRG